MKAELEIEELLERKADSQGRVSLPTGKYSDKTLKIAVVKQMEEPDQDGSQ